MEHTTVFLAFRDLDHERMGRKYCETVSKHFGWTGNVNVLAWNFDMLACGAMGQMAAADARQAQLIVIATSCGESLPPTIKDSVKEWCSPPRTAPGALVVVLSECLGFSEAHWPEYHFLEQQSRRCNRHLIVYASGLAPENGSAFHLPEARRVTAGGLLAVDGFAENAALG